MRVPFRSTPPGPCASRKTGKVQPMIEQSTSNLCDEPSTEQVIGDKSPYRILQAKAMSLGLPGNLRGADLETLITAKLRGQDDFVVDFLNRHKTMKQLKKEEKKAAKESTPLDLTKAEVSAGSTQKTKPPPPYPRHASLPDTATPAPAPAPAPAPCPHNHDQHTCNRSSVWSNSSGSSSGSLDVAVPDKSSTGVKQVPLPLNNGLFTPPPSHNHAPSKMLQPYYTLPPPVGSADQIESERNVPHSGASAFSFPPNPFLPLASQYPTFKSFSFPYYSTEFTFSTREWQAQISPSLPYYPNLPSYEASTSYGQQAYNYYNSAQNASSPSNITSHQGYPQYSSYLPSSYDPFAGPFSSYRSTSIDFSPVKTPPISNLPNFTELKNTLPKAPTLDESSQYLSDLDMDVLIDVVSSQSTSVGSGRSIASSMENNFSWPSHSQDILNFLSSEASFNSASSQLSSKHSKSEDAVSLGLPPPFQCNDSQANLAHDNISSNQQTQAPIPVDYTRPSGNPHHIATSTYTNNSNPPPYYCTSRGVTPPYKEPEYTTPYCDTCLQTSCMPDRACCPQIIPQLLPLQQYRSTASSQVSQQGTKDPQEDSFFDDTNSSVKTLKSDSDSEEGEDMDMEDRLIINEDALSRDSSRMEQSIPLNLEVESDSDKTYLVLEPTFSIKEMVELDGQEVERIINESDSSPETLESYYESLTMNGDEDNDGHVYSQPYTLPEHVTELSRIEDENSCQARESSIVPMVGGQPSSVGVLTANLKSILSQSHCPASGCITYCKHSIQSIEEHIRQCHAADILDVSQFKFTPYKFSVASLIKEGPKSLIIESLNKLFIVRILYYECKIVVVLQYIPKDSEIEQPFSSFVGTLEVIKSNKIPSSWVGNVTPYYSSFTNLLASNECLVLNPAELDAVVSVWADVRPPGTNQNKTPTGFQSGRILRSGKKRKLKMPNECESCSAPKTMRDL